MPSGWWPRPVPFRHYQRLQRALRFLQLPRASRHSVTLSEAKLAAEILKRNGNRFLHFTGGGPVVHRDFPAMLAHATQIGMVPTLVTNGASLTPKRVDTLADAGLATVYILNPVASIEDTQHHLRGEPERFGCLAGWNPSIWIGTCNFGVATTGTGRSATSETSTKLSARDGCTACMIDCYCADSVMQHVGIAISDGVQAAARGAFVQAWQHWTDGRNVISACAAIRTARAWTGGSGKHFKQPTPPEPDGKSRTRDANDQRLSPGNQE